MKLMKIAMLAALVPAMAIASPQRNANQNNQDTTDIETETFEWSSGHARLGLMVMSLTPELRAYFGAPRDAGLLVARVVPNGPAARAGVRVGDVITKIDNDRIQDAIDIMTALNPMQQGEQAPMEPQAQSRRTVSIEVVRDHNTVDLQAFMGKRHQQQPQQGQQQNQQPNQQPSQQGNEI